MEAVRDKIRKIIAIAADVDKDQIKLEHPELEQFGDYSTNIALVLKGGRNLAEEICAKLKAQITNDKIIEKVEVAGPGFMNITLNKNVLFSELNEINMGYGKNESLKGKRIVVEYTDPNPFKELHIGHLYSNVIGETVAKLLEACGAQVWRADFYGDVGVHVAKSVWGLKQKLEKERLTIGQLAGKNNQTRQKYLGEAYAYGTVQYDQDEKVKVQIDHLNTLIYVIAQDLLQEEKGWQPLVDYKKHMNASEFEYREIKEIYRVGLKWSLEYFESMYRILGTKYDGYYPESLVGEYGYQLVMEGLEKGIFEKSEGAVIFRGEKMGQHTRVFVNKNDLPTYEAKDLGLAIAKYKDFPYELDINVTGNEIREYFKVVIPALTAIRPELGKATRALSHGMVNLPEGKMSSRSGNVITVEGLFAEAKKYAKQLFGESAKDINERDKDEIAFKVGIAAVRYAFLKPGIGNDISFNFKESVTFNGDSGPYLQYTYARTQSVLDKVKNRLIYTSENYDMNPEEFSVVRYLHRFSEVMEEAAKRYSPNIICNYLYELAQRYNSFYNQHSILSADNNETVNFRLLLTKATGQVINNGLTLLGIEPLTKM